MANEPNAQPIGWYLEGALNDDRTWVVPITVFPFRVGRHKDCDLPLMPKNISRCHAEIVPLESDLIIRDLESSNGTYVNHKRIRREMALKSGDIVHFGTLEFQILKKDVIDAALGESTILYKNVDEIPKGYDAYMHTFEEMLRKKAVVPYYQPIIKMSSKSIIGYEVLGRSFYKDLPSSPVELFNIASCIGLEADLSQVFRDEGVRVAKSKQGSPNLFVNTHPVEMYRMTLLE
ncbi:MAG: FHA domain-containing protein [Candidatus Dadabacteria bacterium]|nr:FHA domain-containing protein [Candidatus Dadabacteria bacterium]